MKIIKCGIVKISLKFSLTLNIKIVKTTNLRRILSFKIYQILSFSGINLLTPKLNLSIYCAIRIHCLNLTIVFILMQISNIHRPFQCTIHRVSDVFCFPECFKCLARVPPLLLFKSSYLLRLLPPFPAPSSFPDSFSSTLLITSHHSAEQFDPLSSLILCF